MVSLGCIGHHRRFNYWDQAGGGADEGLFRGSRLTPSSSEKNTKDAQCKAKVGVTPGLLLRESFLLWMVQVVVGTMQSQGLFPGSQGTEKVAALSFKSCRMGENPVYKFCGLQCVTL